MNQDLEACRFILPHNVYRHEQACGSGSVSFRDSNVLPVGRADGFDFRVINVESGLKADLCVPTLLD